MRSLRRNQKTIGYALYKGRQDIFDENGFMTGEKGPSYGKTKAVKATISNVGGRISNTAYGKFDDYDITIVIDDTKIPFDEKSIFWIDVPLSTAHDYEVTKINRTFDFTRIYLVRIKDGGRF